LNKKIFLAITIITFLFISCTKDDGSIPHDLEVNDFIWKGLNLYYFWQADVPNLADNKFANQNELNSFLATYADPKNLFDDLLDHSSDRFSWIVDDYIALEQQFQGVSKNNGVEFGLNFIDENKHDIIGYVRYILPNSDASTKNIQRGDLFLEVDGQQLTVNNYRQLLFSDTNSYTLGLASISGSTISLSGETIDLTKEIYTENPIFMTKTFDISGKKIGYLMYNAFNASFDEELNVAFSQFKAEGITDLVLDLRYNGGGRVKTALHLASMITGQFKGQLFSKERWNDKIQAILEQQDPENLVNIFTDKIIEKDNNGNVIFQQEINSLNLNGLYVLVSGSSASASELIINGLKPYLTNNLKLIGTKTIGKHVASVTLYDSENFTRSGVNTNHTYAMQPIVLQEVNNLGENNNNEGFTPDITLAEDLSNLGVLGDEDEPLLQKALDDILTITRPSSDKKKSLFLIMDEISSSKEAFRFSNEMYTTKGYKLKNILFDHENR